MEGQLEKLSALKGGVIPDSFLYSSYYFPDSVQGGDEVHSGKGEEQAKDEGGSLLSLATLEASLPFLTRCTRNY